MKTRFRIRRILLACWTALVLSANPEPAAEPTGDGLYAHFQTTEGGYWCRLEFEKAPRTVANFMSLAEGIRPWIDFPQGRIVQRPFYDGLTFHRVIVDFMNQAGSPNGMGNDGPGYRFRDEFHPELLHDRPGVLAMANAGPNSNGSQFFITVAPTPWLNAVHSVFGEVVEGFEVVRKINEVPVDAGKKPVDPVVIQSLRILRRGTAATAFDPAAISPPLPAVGAVDSQLALVGETLQLSCPARTNTLYHPLLTMDFAAWIPNTTKATRIDVTSLRDAPHFFFIVLTGGYEP
ncbi:MAG: peptidylprolyl isomerase [Limisphaerales bacterium]